MKHKNRLGAIVVGCLWVLARADAQTDWPMFGHDPGAMRYSPLKQINTTNIDQLRLAWQFDTTQENAPPATAPVTPHGSPASEAAPEASSSKSPAQSAAPRRAQPRMTESIPLVVGGVLYTSTGY